jgi:hypothetical protein
MTRGRLSDLQVTRVIRTSDMCRSYFSNECSASGNEESLTSET